MRAVKRRKGGHLEAIILILSLTVILVIAISIALIPGYLLSLGMALEDIRNTMSWIGQVVSVVMVVAMGTILIVYYYISQSRRRK